MSASPYSYTAGGGYISGNLYVDALMQPSPPRPYLYLNERIATELTFVPNIPHVAKTGVYDIDFNNRMAFNKIVYDTNTHRLKHLVESYYSSDSSEYAKVLSFATEFFIDCSCVEVAHTPASCLADLRVLYTAIYEAVKKENLVPFRIDDTPEETIYHPTGGGHIHCDIPFSYFNEFSFFESFKLFESNMIASAVNNPYLLWLVRLPFNNEVKNFYTGKLDCMPESPAPNSLMDCYRPFITRYRSIRSKTRMPTLEFRMFDAPKDADTAVFQARLVQHWVSSVGAISQANKTIPITLTRDTFDKYASSVQAVRAALKKFMYSIQLEHELYRFEPYFENYRVRQKFGSMV